MKKLTLLVLVLLSWGCAVEDHSIRITDVRVSSLMSLEQIEATKQAADRWCSAGASCLTVLVVDDLEANVRFATPEETLELLQDAPAGYLAGEILINVQGIPGYDFLNVITHELGHAMSKQRGHLEEPGHLMSEIVTVDQITDQDVAWVTAQE